MSRNAELGDGGMLVIYDGDCPFCSSYVRLMALRANAKEVELLNARSPDPRVSNLWKQGYDLNAGMVAIYGGAVYHGSDALWLISTLSSSGGIGKRLLVALLRNPTRARLLYPSLKAGRRLALRILRRPDLAPALD